MESKANERDTARKKVLRAGSEAVNLLELRIEELNVFCRAAKEVLAPYIPKEGPAEDEAKQPSVEAALCLSDRVRKDQGHGLADAWSEELYMYERIEELAGTVNDIRQDLDRLFGSAQL